MRAIEIYPWYPLFCIIAHDMTLEILLLLKISLFKFDVEITVKVDFTVITGRI